MYVSWQTAILPITLAMGMLTQLVGQEPYTAPLRRLPAVADHAEESRGRHRAEQASYVRDFAAGRSLADDLNDLQQQVEANGEAIADVRSDLKAKVSPGNAGATMKIAGRVHADYWAFPGDSPLVNTLESGNPNISPQDRFGFRRLRFGLQGTLKDLMEYKIEMDFAGGNNPSFRDAWLGFNNLPLLHTVLIGNQKRPYGLDYLNSSRYNVFIERPFVVEAFNQDARRLGIASYGFSPDQFLNWRWGVYNQELIQSTGNYINDAYQLELAGRLAATYWYDEASDGRGYAHVAVSGTTAYPNGTSPNNGTQDNAARFRTVPEARSSNRWLDTGRIAGAGNYQLLGLEKVFNFGPLQIVGEYQNVWLERGAGFGSRLHFHGGYAYVSYFLTGEHMTWDRTDGTLDRVSPFENFFLVRTCDGGYGWGLGAWQLAFRYSYADFTDGNIFGGIGEASTAGLNWWWNPYARMQFNYINGVIEQSGAARAEGDYDIVGTRFMVDF